MTTPDADVLRKRVLAGLVSHRTAEARERALVEAAREKAAPLPGETRARLRGIVRDVGKSGDLDLILDIEKRLLTEELENQVAAPGQETALENSLKDLGIAADLVKKARDPEAYQAVAADYRRDRNKDRYGAPLDEARQFFKSHVNRLNRAEAALGQGDASEKQLLAVRRGSISAAHKLYQALQAAPLSFRSQTVAGRWGRNGDRAA
ncbi:MAG: hypothetical protein OXU70_15360 [Gammaproteobacteria bacterium]|nr:hypothetical protein [Gammaproteobacteria bacterium]